MNDGGDRRADDEGQELTGGNASGPVRRIGDTVRKPWSSTTPRTLVYLDHLRRAGLDVPRAHGRDERGRLVLDYVPGRSGLELAPLPPATIHRVGALVRAIHDASADLPVPADWPVLLPAHAPDLICHNDLGAWNLVVGVDRLVFIDWDGAGPSTRLWDLAYAALSFAHLGPDADVRACARRLAVFADGYGADASLRQALPAALADRARAMWAHLRRAHETGVQPWADMYVDGHGEHWHGTTRFAAAHRAAWAEALTGS